MGLGQPLLAGDEGASGRSLGSEEAFGAWLRQVMVMAPGNKGFLLIVFLAFSAIGIFYQNPTIAMWLGFAIAAYASIANDSIQTLGTFIASTRRNKWWHLWLFIGGIFVIVSFGAWLLNSGDVSFGRLQSKGIDVSPGEFHFLQVAAPIFLLMITRFRMPVSTTFLLLGAFSIQTGVIVDVLSKTMIGYLVAFSFGFIMRLLFDKVFLKIQRQELKPYWVILQWTSTAILWSLWLVQDISNFAVYLPRQLNLVQFIAFLLIVIVCLGVLFFKRGDKIQEVVEEKTEVDDVRTATIVDLGFILVLFIFTFVNTIPMSTTWVFLGLLAGRELGIKIIRKEKFENTWELIFRDILYATAGLIFSIFIAVAANPTIREEIQQLIGN